MKVGAWERNKFIGVVLFGRGASPNLGKKFSLNQDECVELLRVALTKHTNKVSRIASIALKFLQKTNPRLRLVVSFADPDKGHIGGIYQAGNWVYSGESAATVELFVNRRWVHMRDGFYYKKENTPQRLMPGKHRYLMPLDDDMRKQIQPFSKPYPKRVRSVESDTPINQ